MSDFSLYKFAIDRNFRQKAATSSKEYLAAAESAHPYIEKHKVVTPDGIFWHDEESVFKPGVVLNDLANYMGSSGVTFYYLGLYKATGKKEYLDLVTASADYLDAKWQTQLQIAKDIFEIEGVNDSIYMGIAGIGQVIAAVYTELKRQKDLEAVKAIAAQIIADGKVTNKGLEWSFDKSMLVGGGPVLYLFKAYEVIKNAGDNYFADKVLEAAINGADAILAEAIKDPRGGYAWLSTVHPNQTRVPNFEIGTAGIGYLFAVAYEQTRNEKYLNAAKEAANHLRAIAVKQGDGYLVPWHDNPNEPVIFYASSCHGPAGTSRLFYQLYKTTGDKLYLNDIVLLYKGMRHINVPEKQSVGFWNNTSICCGTAGVLQFVINLALVADELPQDAANIKKDSSDVAKISGNILLGESYVDGERVTWPVAFERVKPEIVTEKINYGAGAAGVGAALTQLYLFLENKYSWARLFDDPYPVKQ